MSDMLGIGSSAVAAYQRALGTVSNNIANVGTEGYVRQETSMAENMPRQQGKIYLGTGVNVAGIKRAYDQFLEQNLRNSTSEMNTQGPMVDYANRVVDIMASETVGLPPALDKFFGTARQLSVDPASTILRGQFLRDADGLASRFRELSTQLQGVDTETREAISAKVADINTLAGQIAVVNKQLAGKPFADRQPPDLMDQRDLLLTKLSKLVKVNVTTALNGSVGVSLGNMSGSGLIVDGDKSVALAVKFDETDLSRVSIIADPYGKTPEEVVGISSGELGGLMSFREQVLQPTFTSLDFLATVVAREVNAIHVNGIDTRGDLGKELFTIQPVTVRDPISGNNLQIDRASAGIKVAINDPTRVAAGALFRVIENENNLSGVDATLSYAPSFAEPSAIRPLSQVLKNNAHPLAAIVPPTSRLLGQIPLGSDNWSLSLHGATSTQQLTVFTRDGRQLTGKALSAEDRTSILTTENGFVKDSSYSDQYLNRSGESGYKQLDVFYGAKAVPIEIYNADGRFAPVTHGIVPAAIPQNVITGRTIPADMDRILANRLSINGKALPELLPAPPATTIQASDMAAWINRTTANMAPPITAAAMTEIQVDGDDIDVSKNLLINGFSIPVAALISTTPYDNPSTAEEKAESLKFAIDTYNQTNNTKISARIDEDDATQLIIENDVGFEGEDIVIGTVSGGNTIAMDAQRIKGTLTFDSDADITLGYGPDGELGDIDQFGMPVGEYLLAVLPRIPKQADIRGFRIPSDVEGVAGGTLVLNRETLPALTPPAGQDFLQASDYVAWINNVGSELDPPVVASASNEVRATKDQLNLSGVGGLTINGVTITTATFNNASDLVLAINDAITNDTSGAITGLAARVADDGGIVIVNDTGDDIRIGSSLSGGRNLLGVANDLYKGTLELTSEGEIRLGFTSGAETPSELAKLGISTQVFIDSPATEDLLVFVNGEGNGMVAGTYDETMKSPDMLNDERIASLRAQRFDVSFISAHQYQITWKNPQTGDITIVAERDYDHAAGIVYQGVLLKLDNPPTTGDKFLIDGNQDGTGDNLNMIALVDLERKGVIGGGGGKTLAQAYEEEVGKVGNFSSQATIAQKALEVVNQQAIEARDKVSGVSLDSEAADLIRFQQAYQAAAKTIQTSGILFDSILQASR